MAILLVFDKCCAVLPNFAQLYCYANTRLASNMTRNPKPEIRPPLLLTCLLLRGGAWLGSLLTAWCFVWRSEPTPPLLAPGWVYISVRLKTKKYNCPVEKFLIISISLRGVIRIRQEPRVFGFVFFEYSVVHSSRLYKHLITAVYPLLLLRTIGSWGYELVLNFSEKL